MDETKKELSDEIPSDTTQTDSNIDPKPNEQNSSENKTGKRKVCLTKIIVSVVICALIICTIVVVVSNKKEENKGNEITIDSILVTVKETLNTTTLNIAEYPYQGVCNWFHEESDGSQTRVGYIEYAGKVKYSIDFSKIVVENPDENGVVKIIIPPVTSEANIDAGSLAFIYDTKNTKKNFQNSEKQILYTICEEDMNWKVNKDKSIIEHAKKYAKEFIESITNPFFKDGEYSIAVLVGENK